MMPALVDDEVAVDQRRQRLVGIEVDQVFRRPRRVDLDEAHVEFLLGQHDPHAMAARIVVAGDTESSRRADSLERPIRRRPPPGGATALTAGNAPSGAT